MTLSPCPAILRTSASMAVEASINKFSTLTMGRNILLSFISAAETELYKCNQHKIRVDLYSGLADAISSGEFGRKVILPSSLTGSPRQMFELYQDSMSIVRK